MSRKQLLDISERFFRWIDSHDVNPDDLATFAAKDIVVSTPLPGTTPDFAGLIAYHTKVITGSSDFKLTLINALADEVESSVVHYIQVNGTHDGYCPFGSFVLIFRIWMGIPATGKKFQFQGIVINKVCDY